MKYPAVQNVHIDPMDTIHIHVMLYFLLQQLFEYTNKVVQACSQINILT